MAKKHIPVDWDIIDGGKSSASQKFRAQQKVSLSSDKRNKKREIKGAKSINKKFRGKILIYILTGAITLGTVHTAGHTLYNKFVPITIEQAVNSLGMTYADLGISEYTIKQLEKLEEELDSGDLSLNDLTDCSENLEALELDVIKSKLAKSLGIKSTDIKVYSRADSSSASAETIRVTTEDGEQVYVENDLFNLLSPNNTFSQEIADFILTIANTQTIASKISSGNVDYEDTIEYLKKQIQKTNIFAATQISVNDKGNIVVHITRQKDLPKTSQETSLLKSADDELEH